MPRKVRASGQQETVLDPESLPDFTPWTRARTGQRLYLSEDSDRLITDRPFVIFALQLDRTLGDFIMRCLFAASIKLLFENPRLHVYFRNDRPYKRAITRLLPSIDYTWEAGKSWSLPMDWFDIAAGKPIKPHASEWKSVFAGAPDVFLTPSMMRPYDLGAFDAVARMRVPDGTAQAAHGELLQAGLDPDAWFCVLHYREPNYGPRADDGARDLDPQAAIDVTRYITGELGGQVVRIGHPEMAEFPKIDGFIDLSRHANPFMLHAYAISRARFFFEASPSGPMALSVGFGVPVARCNDVSLGGPADAKSIVLPQHLLGPDGRRVDQAYAISKSLLTNKAIEVGLGKYGYRLLRNSTAELRAAARDIFERTADCGGWRELQPPVAPPPTNVFRLPRREVRRFTFVEYPDLAPGMAPA
jgi:putative glycosyltransferase (TIGR04372 family)